jgi:hypothetical protein
VQASSSRGYVGDRVKGLGDLFLVDVVEEEGEQVDAGDLVAFGGVVALAL